MKKSIVFVFFYFFLFSFLFCDEALISLIKEKNWNALPRLFSDNSYEKIQVQFAQFKDIRLSTVSKNEILYKIKLDDHAEVGFIVFNKENGLIANASIENQIKPIYYFSGYRKYSVSNCQFKLGDAEITLAIGTIYEALPRSKTGFLFFEGDWKFTISPSDSEERLTLIRNFKSDVFIKFNNTGIFILQNRDFLNNFKSEGDFITLDSPALSPLRTFFDEYFGFMENDFQEIWYLSVQESENVAIFEKDKKSMFFFDFNEYGVPDSQLRSTDNNRLYLNYNSIHLPKLFISRTDDLNKVNLSLYFNPDNNFVSGTVTLFFKNHLTFRTLNLIPSLTIRQGTADFKMVNMFRRGNSYYISSPETDSMTFYFNGTVESDEQIPDLIRVIFENNIQKTVDNFSFFSRNLDFFPNIVSGFFRSNFKLSIPEKYSCLASGKEVSLKNALGRKNYHFSADATKGLAMICGDFEKRMIIDSKIPIHVYCHKDLRLRKYLDTAEIKECMDFLTDLYGELSVPVVNLLLRRWRDDGGISNTGFVILNILEPFTGIMDISTRIFVRDSPVVLTSSRRDFFLHELAHQWWGGQVSWSNFRDEWITEGMAHFSTLLFLRDTLSEKKFNNITARLLRWALKYNDAGPIIYGKRIANLDQYDAFQSVIYNKTALVLLMLDDIVGHDELMKRMRSLLVTKKYRNISTRDFINSISEGEVRLVRFLNRWIYSRKIPEVTYTTQVTGNEAVITVSQGDADFVFPIWIDVVTEKGNSQNMEVIDQSTQKITLKTDSMIRSIHVSSKYAPVVLLQENGAT